LGNTCGDVFTSPSGHPASLAQQSHYQVFRSCTYECFFCLLKVVLYLFFCFYIYTLRTFHLHCVLVKFFSFIKRSLADQNLDQLIQQDHHLLHGLLIATFIFVANYHFVIFLHSLPSSNYLPGEVMPTYSAPKKMKRLNPR
jgi:hypothetical protein